MADTILNLRQDILTRRLRGGSNRVLWSASDAAQVRQHIWSQSERVLLGTVEVKLFDSQRLATVPVATHIMSRAMDSSALAWQFQISNELPDLMMDVIKVPGW